VTEQAFSVQIPGEPERKLRPGDTLYIGASSDNELVLRSKFTADRHAKLSWEGGSEPLAQDLGSRCGTFLNGIRLFGPTPIPLRSGTLTVGGVELQLLFADREALLTGVSDRVSLFSDSGPTLKGSLAGVEDLKKVLRRLETNKRTGTLTLDDGEGESAVTFYTGKIMGADTAGLEGIDALGAIVKACAGVRYRFVKEFEPKDQQLGFWPSDLLRRLGA
jgi:pSer/pThr/pTyr-binding forkhead associated (FHA) protein